MNGQMDGQTQKNGQRNERKERQQDRWTNRKTHGLTMARDVLTIGREGGNIWTDRLMMDEQYRMDGWMGKTRLRWLVLRTQMARPDCG